jgi:hypothetical protein
MSVRGQWQLKTVVLRYCKTGGSSKGVRCDDDSRSSASERTLLEGARGLPAAI